jgi:hypothetical protein
LTRKGSSPGDDPAGTKRVIRHDCCEGRGQDIAWSHRQERMTNISWWGNYNGLASHVLLGRRKGCSGSILPSYLFWWLSLLSQPCLSPRRRVDGTVSPGQGEAATIVRPCLLMERMGTYMVADMGTTDIPPSPTTDKPRPALTKPRADLPNQNRPTNKRYNYRAAREDLLKTGSS